MRRRGFAMKIIGISSSPRGKNSNTLRLLNAALEGAKAKGAEVEVIDVTKLNIRFCTGCLVCRRTGECVIKDDYPALMKELMAADGLILSCPNYIHNVPGQLKVVFDRSANCVHEQQLAGKYGFSIMTAGGSDEELVLGIMNHFLTLSGATVTGGVGHLMNRGPAAFEGAIGRAREMGADLAEAIEEKRVYPEQAAAREAWKKNFAKTIKANEKTWSHNYDYWVKTGWL